MTSTFSSSDIYPSTNYILLKVANNSYTWEAARIGTYVAANNGDVGGYPGGLAFYTKDGDGSSSSVATLKMVLDANGNLGIGTTRPSSKLNVNGTLGVTGATTLSSTLSVANTITLTGGTAAKQRIYFDSTHYIELDSSGYFHFSHGVYSDGFVSALGLNSGGGSSAADYIPLSGSNQITGSLTPSTIGCNLGSSGGSNTWNTVYANYINIYSTGYFSGGVGIGTAADSSYKLKVNGKTYFPSSQVTIGTDGTTSAYSLYVSSLTNGVGSLLAEGNVKFSGHVGIAANASSTYKLYIGGGGTSKSIWAEGDIYTHGSEVDYSDIRLKNIIGSVDLELNKIANAPLFKFTWKDRDLNRVRVGTSAQYWQTVLPQTVVLDDDGYLGFTYNTAALISAVITARKVVDHEARIRLLEVENAALRNEINQLKKVA